MPRKSHPPRGGNGDSAAANSRKSAQTTRPFNSVYPEALRAQEQAALRRRREQSRTDPRRPAVGMALSGGGIRSATFCLGLFQALARRGLVGKLDFLSTVSGGGYFGSFLGALFQRANPANVAGTEAALANSNSWPVRWLRDNGRYLSPNGAGDIWVFAAAMLRNWVAVHVVLLTFILLLLSLATLVRSLVWVNIAHFSHPAGQPPFYEAFFSQHPVLSVWWSPFLLLPGLTFLFLMAPAGGLYWLTQSRLLMQLVRRLASWRLPNWAQFSLNEVANRLRRLLSSALAVSLLVFLGLTAFAAVDSLGQTLYARWAGTDFSFPALWTGCSAAGMVVLGLAQKLFVWLEKLPGRRPFRVPVNVVALVASLVWSGVIVVSLSIVTYGQAWRWSTPWAHEPGGVLQPMQGHWLLAGTVVLTLLCSWWFSRAFGFVNLSSHQQLYAARLKRAYLGASNPQRQRARQYNITNPIPGDEIPLDDYRPHEHGGPLHLINVTLNETVSGKSQIEQRDRKGLALAVGPGGVSVGIHDHALWHGGTAGVQPLRDPAGANFHALHGDRAAVVHSAGGHPVEPLGLGHWVAISGAAFTTGLGSGTTLGLSLLLGLANVRLGYWWNCGVGPEERSARTRPTLTAQAGEWFARILPVQACLMDEFLARFHGPGRRHWYLSDGGHFENTGCYELIRRRVPFIIASDAGRDTQYQFADIANLARKARTDFGAEIEFVRNRSHTNPAQTQATHPLPALEDLVHPELLKVIGAPEDFAPVPGAAPAPSSPSAGKSEHSAKHAMLARVHYLDTHETSWMLFLKPSLTGDESADVLQYQKTQPDFPQESTMDQYFDEAQWESYRKLGEHIADLVFTPPAVKPTGPQPAWSPSQMRPPRVAENGSPPRTRAPRRRSRPRA